MTGELRKTPHPADASTGIGVHKLEILWLFSINKRPEAVQLRDINSKTEDETFFEFSLKEENWR